MRPLPGARLPQTSHWNQRVHSQASKKPCKLGKVFACKNSSGPLLNWNLYRVSNVHHSMAGTSWVEATSSKVLLVELLLLAEKTSSVLA